MRNASHNLSHAGRERRATDAERGIGDTAGWQHLDLAQRASQRGPRAPLVEDGPSGAWAMVRVSVEDGWELERDPTELALPLRVLAAPRGWRGTDALLHGWDAPFRAPGERICSRQTRSRVSAVDDTPTSDLVRRAPPDHDRRAAAALPRVTVRRGGAEQILLAMA